jgi:acyl-CoA synthetase (AMP-forming)/AMP-acid ligase II/acyl carrier protein
MHFRLRCRRVSSWWLSASLVTRELPVGATRRGRERGTEVTEPDRDDRTTWVDVLRQRAQEQPDRQAFTFLTSSDGAGCSLTWGELDQRARAVGACLQENARVGDHAVLLCPPGLDYIVAFCGCIYAGVVPSPTYVPDFGQSLQPVEHIARSTGARIGLTTTAMLPAVRATVDRAPVLGGLKWIPVNRPLDGLAERWRAPKLSPDSLICLLYSSGSTATPKGVVHTHASFVHQGRVVYSYWRQTPESKAVIWTPPHSTISISHVNLAIVGGFSAVLLPPPVVLERILCWLEVISRTCATTSSAPSFAFDLCVQAIAAEQDVSLDLRSWTVAGIGTERVRADTVERFTRAFRPYGFRPEAMTPRLGSSETTMIASNPPGALPTVRSFEAAALAESRVVPASAGDETGVRLVGCGYPPPDQEVLIVNPRTRTVCPPDEVGEIWVRSGSVGLGYWGLPAETEYTFRAYLAESGRGPYVRTGDLGFFLDGELFHAGREKELIMIRGRGLLPEDIERAAERSHPNLRPGASAAFSVEADGEERLVIVQEVEPETPDLLKAAQAIRRAVAEQHGTQAYAVVLAGPGAVSKTALGKIQRQKCRAAFLEGSLPDVYANFIDRPGSPQQQAPFVAPRTPREQELADMWAEILSVERVGIDDSFFLLGGDSLLATRILSRIRGRYALDLPLSTLFERQTVRELAREIDLATALHSSEDREGRALEDSEEHLVL